MAGSTLDLDNIPVPDRQLGKGHGADALGPSDLSDTGSDVQGGYSGSGGEDLGLDRGTNEDSDTHRIELSGDTDWGGTGESSTAGRNNDVELGGDIGFDRIETMGPNGEIDSPLDDDLDPGDTIDSDWPPSDGTSASPTRH